VASDIQLTDANQDVFKKLSESVELTLRGTKDQKMIRYPAKAHVLSSHNSPRVFSDEANFERMVYGVYPEVRRTEKDIIAFRKWMERLRPVLLTGYLPWVVALLNKQKDPMEALDKVRKAGAGLVRLAIGRDALVHRAERVLNVYSWLAAGLLLWWAYLRANGIPTPRLKTRLNIIKHVVLYHERCLEEDRPEDSLESFLNWFDTWCLEMMTTKTATYTAYFARGEHEKKKGYWVFPGTVEKYNEDMTRRREPEKKLKHRELGRLVGPGSYMTYNGKKAVFIPDEML